MVVTLWLLGACASRDRDHAHEPSARETASPLPAPADAAASLATAAKYAAFLADGDVPIDDYIADTIVVTDGDAMDYQTSRGKDTYLAPRRGKQRPGCKVKLTLAAAGHALVLRYCEGAAKAKGRDVVVRGLNPLTLQLDARARIQYLRLWNDRITEWSQVGAPIGQPFEPATDPWPDAQEIRAAATGSALEAAREQAVRAIVDALDHRDPAAVAAALGTTPVLAHHVHVSPPRRQRPDELASWLMRDDVGAVAVRYTIHELWSAGDWTVLRMTHSSRLPNGVFMLHSAIPNDVVTIEWLWLVRFADARIEELLVYGGRISELYQRGVITDVQLRAAAAATR